jgi:choline dehydrogenase-like flavoprotein
MADIPRRKFLKGSAGLVSGLAIDHENLWVIGTPTMVSSGCDNGTLTFSALALRAAAALEDTLH